MLSQRGTRREKVWIYDVLFLLVFVLAGYLRLTGVNWGEGQHQHPDENFLEGVLASLQSQKCADATIPVEACPPEQRTWLSIADYFNSQKSTLNPYNRGYSFYVYGNLPMTLTRVAVDAMHVTDVKMLGRQFSALADLFTILFLYLAVSRLYNQRVALLASLFSALAVLQIQQSHFFTTDLFVNAFAFLAIYLAVRILDAQGPEKMIREAETEAAEPVDAEDFNAPVTVQEEALPKQENWFASYRPLLTSPLFLLSIGFGLAFGMALASKVNIYPLALLLPGAFAVRHLEQHKGTDLRSFKQEYWYWIVACLVAGGLAAIISFRIFQPYAFDGLGPSLQWISNIREQRIQAAGDSDVPWSLQWARRSHLYSFENLTKWGLGLPLGILAWAGFLLMGWRVFKGEWRHALLWGWTALYFLWQSMQFNPTMRYQLPIYPLLCMMAAWFIFEVAGWEVGTFKRSNVRTFAAALIGIVVVALTAAWAFAFHSIYIRDEPRIAASRWIYQNIPGPINLRIETGQDGTTPYNQPLPFPYGVNIQPSMPYQTSFTAQRDGVLKEILLGHVAAYPEEVPAQLHLSVLQNPGDPQPLASTFTNSSQDVLTALSQTATFDPAPALAANQTYYLKLETATPEGTVNICGPVSFSFNSGGQVTQQTLDAFEPCTVTVESPYLLPFTPQVDGTLNQVVLGHTVNPDAPSTSAPKTLSLSISSQPDAGADPSAAKASVQGTFDTTTDPRGDSYTLTLDKPIVVKKGNQYYLNLAVDSGVLALSGSAVSNETDYDYGLPFRVDGYDAFGGIYSGDLTQQVYWDDNADKLNRFVNILNQTDYIFIPTNHQYAQITRLPERYPLMTYYYRELMGCPQDADIIKCYHEAKPGDYQGRLGFDLVAVFETYPKLGNLEINDQYAEEAFTFYDHPKALIFKKSENFNIEEVKSSLSTVDVTKAIHLAPRQFKDYSNLMLPAARLAMQRAGGTWSQLFDYSWAWNKYPVLGLLIWYLFIFLLGLAVYPLIRLAMPRQGLSPQPGAGTGAVRLPGMAWRLIRHSLYASHHRRHLPADPAARRRAGLVSAARAACGMEREA